MSNLYTGKGDGGTTKLFNCPPGKRVSKSDFVFEALGGLDELNSLLGYAKVLSKKSKITLGKKKLTYKKILEEIQQNLFCIQAGVGGSDMGVGKRHVKFLEEIIAEVEKKLPPIKFFTLSGGGELGAYLDILRSKARSVERNLIRLSEMKGKKVNKDDLVYMNRLSSVFFALSRYVNFKGGYKLTKPTYK